MNSDDARSKEGEYDEPEFVPMSKLISQDPLLENHPNNHTRQRVINEVRSYLNTHGLGEKPEYEKAMSLLGTITPDSRYALWDDLLKELMRLGDRSAQPLHIVRDRVLDDLFTLPSDDKGSVRALDIIMSKFETARQEHLGDLRKQLEYVTDRVGNKISLGSHMRCYIVNLARFDHDTDDVAIMHILNNMYVKNGLYDPLCDICEDMMGFKGADRLKMMGSIIIEYAIMSLLEHIALNGKISQAKEIIDRCRDLLERRESVLSLNCGINPSIATFNYAYYLASDIARRRTIKSAVWIDSWIKVNHPDSYAFLQLGEAKINKMIQKKSILTRHVSACVRSNIPLILDKLDNILQVARQNNIRLRGIPGKWVPALRSRHLYETAFEMEVYVRLMLDWGKVELHPSINCGKKADYCVDDLYIEAYAPHGYVWPNGKFLSDAKSEFGLHTSILEKEQLDHFGRRQSMLVVNCPHELFGNAELGKLLRCHIREKTQLGVIVLVNDWGYHSSTQYLINDCADVPVPLPMVKKVMAALEKPLGRV